MKKKVQLSKDNFKKDIKSEKGLINPLKKVLKNTEKKANN